MKCALVLLFFVVIPVFYSISLPADRARCKTQNALIVNEVRVPISLNFNEESFEVKSLVKRNCISHRYNHPVSKRKRRSRHVKPLSKRSIILSALGRYVLKHTKLKIAEPFVKQVELFTKYWGKDIVKSDFIVKELEENSQLKQLIGNEENKDDKHIKFTTEIPDSVRTTETPKTETTITHKEFGNNIARILSSGTLGDLMNIVPDVMKVLNATLDYTLSDGNSLRHLKLKNAHCTSDFSIDVEVDVFRTESAIFEVESCEDIGYFNTVNEYFHYWFPDFTYSNNLGNFEVDSQFCVESNKLLVCFPSAIQKTSCSVQEVDGCVLEELSYAAAIERKKYFGISKLETANLRTPYEGTFSEGFKLGMSIEIKGKIGNETEWFGINLISQNGDIPLHINPRFDKQEVVFNSFSCGQWQDEIKPNHFPFARGKSFDITLSNGKDYYEITLNGTKLLQFPHRAPNHGDIKKIRITGDIEIEELITIKSISG